METCRLATEKIEMSDDTSANCYTPQNNCNDMPNNEVPEA